MRGPRREGGSGSHKLDKTTFFYRFYYLYLLYYRIFKYSLKTQDKLVSFWGEGRGGRPWIWYRYWCTVKRRVPLSAAPRNRNPSHPFVWMESPKTTKTTCACALWWTFPREWPFALNTWYRSILCILKNYLTSHKIYTSEMRGNITLTE